MDVHRHLQEELSAFLSVVTGTLFHLPQTGHAWTWDTAEGTSSVRTLGYIDTAEHLGMPSPGTCPSIPLGPQEEIEQQQAMPKNTVALWKAYRALTLERQQQFLAAAAKFQEVLLHWGQRDTASFTAMVVACEALKPARRDVRVRPARRPWRWVQVLRRRSTVLREHNMYDVIEALLGKQAANRLRTQLFDPKIHPKIHPQAVRNAHLHRGELYGSEFAPVMTNFRDPTFDAASRELLG